MELGTEIFLAWRYFKPKRSAVSVITLISIIGVILGVAVLIVVLAVMTGFTDHLKNKLLETGAHAQIRKQIRYTPQMPGGTSGVFSEEEAEAVCETVKKTGGDGVPVLLSPVLLQVNDIFAPKALIAYNPYQDKTKRIPLEKAVRSGKLSLKKDEIMVSDVIAGQYGLRAGDKILLHSPTHLSRLVERDPQTGRYKVSDKAEMYLPGEYTITGTFSFDKYDFDKDIMFMGLDAGDSLFNLDYGSATHIYVWTDDPFNMDLFTEKLKMSLFKINPGLETHTWKDMHSRILGVLAVEKNMQFFLLIFIVLVAAFSIANTLITTVIQKTREIGLLKAMGTSSAGILRIFLLQGFFVGVVGSIGGVLLGWLVIVYRMNILAAMRFISGQEIFPKEVYLFRELPAHIIWSDVAVITLISILLCTCGALLPALRAASLDPAKALRYE